MSKLLEDEKVAKLVDREVTKAVKAEKKRILEELKTLKGDYASGDYAEDKKTLRVINGVVTETNKIVRAA